MLHHVKDLSPEQRRAIESLIGRQLSEHDDVSIRPVPSDSGLSSVQRGQLLTNLRDYFEVVDSQRTDASEEEASGAIDEALGSLRPGYRSVK